MLRNLSFYPNFINKLNFLKSKKVNYLSYENIGKILKSFHINKSQKHVLIGLITIPVTILSYNYSICYCDNSIIENKPNINELLMQVNKEKDIITKSLFQSFQENTLILTNNVIKLVNYIQRLIMYALFGIPFVGLLPVSYTLG